MRDFGRIIVVIVLVLLSACSPADDSPSAECDSASREAIPIYRTAGACFAETDPSNAVGLDECLFKTRYALELIERAEEVCTGETLTEIQSAKELMLERLSTIEKAQAYNRGEIDAGELLEQLLDE